MHFRAKARDSTRWQCLSVLEVKGTECKFLQWLSFPLSHINTLSIRTERVYTVSQLFTSVMSMIVYDSEIITFHW